MKTLKLHVKNFGCQMNKLDSALVTSALQQQGMELTNKTTEADIILMNTCSVREHAEQRVLSNLGHLQHMKKKRPQVIVAVAGCMAQRMGDELLNHPAVNVVAGPAQLHKLPDLIADALKEHKKAISVTEKIRQTEPDTETQKLDNFELEYDSDQNHIPGQAFVRAMRGCNNFCSYCIVPYVRGPEVSRPPKEIVEQVKKLTQQGVKQITLLGQTVNSYCYHAGEKTYGLADLLELISNLEAVEWIRFITSHPKKFDLSIVKSMADNPKVCPYLHMPAQSGSDRILKAMNRGYTASDYLQLLDKIRDILPDTAIASDFIVGFPDETQQDFEDTLNLVKKAQYKNCFVFKYSPRPGTVTEKKLQDNVPYDVKKQRNINLLAFQENISESYNRHFIGQTFNVLVEGQSKKAHLNSADNNAHPQLIARTATDYIVVFNGPPTLTGQFAKVKITKTSALTLFGTLIS